MKNRRMAAAVITAVIGFGGLVVAPAPAQAAKVTVECTTTSGSVAYEKASGTSTLAAIKKCFRAHGNAKWGSPCVNRVSVVRDGDNWYGAVTKKKGGIRCGRKAATINLVGWVV